MAYSSQWLRFRAAEDNFFTCRQDFGMRDEEAVITDLHEALASPYDMDTALRFLQAFLPRAAFLEPLLPKIVDTAIDSSHITSIGLARDVLSNYKDEPVVKSAIVGLITDYLAANDEWHYRRIAELYEQLDYKDELAGFLALCRASDNWEIREISDDF